VLRYTTQVLPGYIIPRGALRAGMVVTIEPGMYFIEAALEPELNLPDSVLVPDRVRVLHSTAQKYQKSPIEWRSKEP
jgi:Xaa-Pro aminopeptidase